MGKRGDFVWSRLANIILVVVFLIVLILGIYFLRENIYDVWERISDFFRFGR